jgi:hypothetical protein
MAGGLVGRCGGVPVGMSGGAWADQPGEPLEICPFLKLFR